MAANLEALVARLEVATSRLESLAASGGVGGGAAAGGADAGASSEALEAFDALVNGTLKTFLDLSAKIGGEVKEQVRGRAFSRPPSAPLSQRAHPRSSAAAWPACMGPAPGRAAAEGL